MTAIFRMIMISFVKSFENKRIDTCLVCQRIKVLTGGQHLQQGVVVHILNLECTTLERQKQVNLSEFKAMLVQKMSSRPARSTW